jgi:hypothetical protein
LELNALRQAVEPTAHHRCAKIESPSRCVGAMRMATHLTCDVSWKDNMIEKKLEIG